MTDHPGNKNRLEDEDPDQVAGGTPRFKTADYLSQVVSYTAVTVTDPAELNILKNGSCPLCGESVSCHNSTSYGCIYCEHIFIPDV